MQIKEMKKTKHTKVQNKRPEFCQSKIIVMKITNK